MEIGTGYFAKARQYVQRGYALVSIARTAPWFIAKELKVYPLDALAPTDEILALKDRPTEYTKRYKEEVLRNLDPIRIFATLMGIGRQEQTDKVVMMCYERPEVFCHRHIVAEWLNKCLGSKVAEVKDESPLFEDAE